MDFLNLTSSVSFLFNDNLFKNDPTLGTPRASLSLNKSTNTVYAKYVKCKKALWTTFLWDYFFSRYSFSLDAETEAVYDNYKSYDWKSSILWFKPILQ